MSMLKGLSVGVLWGGILASVVALVLSLATPVPGSRLADAPAPSMPEVTALAPPEAPLRDPSLPPPHATDTTTGPATEPIADVAADPAPPASDLATDTAPSVAPHTTGSMVSLEQPGVDQPLPAVTPSVVDPPLEPMVAPTQTVPSLPPSGPPGPVARIGTPALTVLGSADAPEFDPEQIAVPERPAALAPPQARGPEPAPPVALELPTNPLANPAEPTTPRIAALGAPMPAPVTEAVPDVAPIEQAPNIANTGEPALPPVDEARPEAGVQGTVPSPEIAVLGPAIAAPAAVDAPLVPSVPDAAHARAAQDASPVPLTDAAPHAAGPEPQAPAFPAPNDDPVQHIASLAEPEAPNGTVPRLSGPDSVPETARAQGLGAVEATTVPRVSSNIGNPPEADTEILLAQAPVQQAPPAVTMPQDTAPQTAPPALLAIAPPSPGPRPDADAPAAASDPLVRNPLEDRTPVSTGLGLPQVSRFGVTQQTGAAAEPAPEPELEPEARDLPALLAHAATFEQGETRPLLAIVLLAQPDVPIDADAIAALPIPVTVALTPQDAEQADALRAMGLEIALQIGEASDAALDAALAALPETVALLDDAEGTLQTDRDALDRVLVRMRQTGHGLVTYPRGFNTAERMAAREGLAAATLFRDLAGLPEAEMRRVLDRAGFAAGLEGTAVVAAPLQPDVLATLVGWALGDRSDAIAIAPVSAVLQRR